MSRIRILRIQSRICIGGPALHSILLSAHLNADRYQTLLVGGRLDPGEKSMEPLALDKGVALHLIEEMGRVGRWTEDLRALWRLIRLIRLYRPHIVHTHTAKAGALGRVAAWLCRVPIRVHTFHGHVFHGYFSPMVNRLILWAERFLGHLAHRVVAISPRQFDDLTRDFRAVAPRRCRVIRLGFQLDHITGGTPGRFRQSLGLGYGVKLVAILARLVPIKNHELFLRAIAAWRAFEPEATPEEIRFLIIGDGELRPDLEALAATLEIAPFVIFTGWRRDTPDIYADIDLNVLVSKNEGTPVTLIEGLACGVPILCTEAGGIRDIADESCGVMVPTGISPGDLGGELRKLLGREGGLRRLPDPVRRRISATFDVKRLVADVEALYEELIDERMPKPFRQVNPAPRI